jgi:5-methylcytosine-specific restriction endonuclease McrA
MVNIFNRESKLSYLSLFKMPNPVKITARSSSITNSFVNSIIPVIQPTEAEVKAALNALGMDMNSCSCAFCGDKATEWDHLRALVKNKRPTGFISEIHNLVPACGKCNQSKGNTDWETWMRGNAKLSPHTRGITDLAERIERLKEYEKIQQPTRIDFEKIIGKSEWESYWQNCQMIHDSLQEIQPIATTMRHKIAAQYSSLIQNPESAKPSQVKSITQKTEFKKLSKKENIQYLEQFKLFIMSKGVGEKDRVASSVDSYASYLNSVANQLKINISPTTLGNQAQLESVKSQLLSQKTKPKTLGNLMTAAKHYVDMILSNNFNK